MLGLVCYSCRKLINNSYLLHERKIFWFYSWCGQSGKNYAYVKKNIGIVSKPYSCLSDSEKKYPQYLKVKCEIF